MKKIMLIVLLFLGACASDVRPGEDASAEEIYLYAHKAFQETDYEKAAEEFDKIEQNYPYSEWAERAQIMMAYAQYKQNEYTDAIMTLERFLQLHPGNRNAVYALYLKGLCYFEQMSDPLREQEMSQKADNTFRELLARFPNSIYIKDAQVKLELIQNTLAGKELAVGRYYQQHEDYVAAMNRFQRVLIDYPNSNQKEEALYRLAACYQGLGLTPQTKKVRKKLKNLFPESEWNKKADKLFKG
ncbi:MAG: outer membrane protein assembly factor BamD [Alphaproteobacteria bacterium]|nr:outer membrane protein assembly factor BamD [Alphaproteobacteria bacterium]